MNSWSKSTKKSKSQPERMMNVQGWLQQGILIDLAAGAQRERYAICAVRPVDYCHIMPGVCGRARRPEKAVEKQRPTRCLDESNKKREKLLARFAEFQKDLEQLKPGLGIQMPVEGRNAAKIRDWLITYRANGNSRGQKGLCDCDATIQTQNLAFRK
jgi:hypothetical protein